MKIVNAEYYCHPDRWSQIRVKADVDRDDWADEYYGAVFEERDGVYRADMGDFVRFFSWTEPSTGYGGKVFTVLMADGSVRKLKGPWSSRESVVNTIFDDKEPIIHVVCDSCSMAVKVSALEKVMGVKMVKTEVGGEIQYFHPEDWKMDHVRRGGYKEIA